MPEHEIGVVGLATMGENLARNLASHGVRVAVYNRTRRRTDDFMAAHSAEGDFRPAGSLEELVRILDDDELEGVLAHELSHVTNRDVLISTVAATLAGAFSVNSLFQQAHAADFHAAGAVALVGDPLSVRRPVGFGILPAHRQLANILQMKASVKGQDVAMAFRAGDVAVRGLVPITIGLPDLVTLGAGFSSGIAVVEARAG